MNLHRRSDTLWRFSPDFDRFGGMTKGQQPSLTMLWQPYPSVGRDYQQRLAPLGCFVVKQAAALND